MIRQHSVTRRPMLRPLILVGLAATLGYSLRAGANGIPTTNALSYAGILEDATGPMNGSHNIQVVMYDAATGGNNLCQTVTAPVSVTDGHFSVQLPDPCSTTAVGNNADVWVDVLVDGSDTGRTKVGAVPYAVEANRASAATGTLAQQVVPAHAVMAFNLSACPAGWTAFSAANGRVVVGTGTLSLGQNVGADQVTLTVQQMPAHTHGSSGQVFLVDHYPATSTGYSLSGGYPNVSVYGDTATQSTGGGQAFDNRQASVALLYCQKN